MRFRKLGTTLAGAAAIAIFTVSSAGAAGTVLYDTVPDPLPSNLTSLGYAATQTSEFGQQVTLAAGATADSVTVVMSSWACADGVSWTAGCGAITEGNETYSHPITVNIYEDNAGDAGTLIKTVTQDVNVPFRPAADPTCADPTNWRDTSGACFSGYAFTVSFDLDATVLPTSFIYAIAYGTSGPADSLNVGLTTSAPTAGTAGDIFWDSTYLGRTPGLTNDGDWGYNITARFETAAAALTADDCKDGGFAAHGFKNQGQCVASVNANENAGL